MISNNMYNGINLLGQSLNASLLRHNVISENIANEDTPGYKRKDVKFDGLLQQALLSNDGSSTTDINSITPQVVVDNKNLSYRLDGNNVNIDTEMTELTKNQIKFNILVDQVSNNFSRIKTVLSR